MTHTPPNVTQNCLNRHKEERQIADRKRSGYKKRLPGVETNQDATKRSRRPPKGTAALTASGPGHLLSTNNPPLSVHKPNASLGSWSNYHARRPWGSAAKKVVLTSNRKTRATRNNEDPAESTITEDPRTSSSNRNVSHPEMDKGSAAQRVVVELKCIS